VEFTLEMELQGALGNIEAGIQDGGVVLTHTCENASRVAAKPTRSSNGSSLDQRAAVERALLRITLQAYARCERSHSSRPLPTCRREGDSSLDVGLPKSKRTLLQIQVAKTRRGEGFGRRSSASPTRAGWITSARPRLALAHAAAHVGSGFGSHRLT
jgi:hypothetical protein